MANGPHNKSPINILHIPCIVFSRRSRATDFEHAEQFGHPGSTDDVEHEDTDQPDGRWAECLSNLSSNVQLHYQLHTVVEISQSAKCSCFFFHFVFSGKILENKPCWIQIFIFLFHTSAWLYGVS